MCEMCKFKNIKLEEAMTMDLTQRVRLWVLQGFPVQANDIPKKANVQATYVYQSSEGHISLMIKWTIEGDFSLYFGIVDEFITLEELKDKFPKLFEFEGNLYA